MMRTQLAGLLLLANCLSIGTPSYSQGLDVYRSESDARLASEMLYEHLTALAHERLERRRSSVQKIQTPQQVALRQQEIRRKLTSMLGPFPEATRWPCGRSRPVNRFAAMGR